jgi:hypothetical protein
MFSSNNLFHSLTILMSVCFIITFYTPQNVQAATECPACEIGIKGDSQHCVLNGDSAVCLGCDFDHSSNLTTINCDAKKQAGATSTPGLSCSTLITIFDTNK